MTRTAQVAAAKMPVLVTDSARFRVSALPVSGAFDMLRFRKFTIGWAWTGVQQGGQGGQVPGDRLRRLTDLSCRQLLDLLQAVQQCVAVDMQPLGRPDEVGVAASGIKPSEPPAGRSVSSVVQRQIADRILAQHVDFARPAIRQTGCGSLLRQALSSDRVPRADEQATTAEQNLLAAERHAAIFC